MKVLAIISVFCFLAILLNGAGRVGSRKRRHFHALYQLFVFGDSFADTGNIPKSDLSQTSRQWYSPYGSSRGDPSGRFSDGFVQSDFIARILGRFQAPLTYTLNKTDTTGMNFAVGGAGVFEVPRKAPTLAEQINFFKQLIEDGRIYSWQLPNSVALVAISGNDYERVANMSSETEMVAFIKNVTTEMAKGVEELQKIGVTKVLVNTLHPVGCTPWLTRPANYTECNATGNMGSYIHNRDLKEKLNANNSDSVYVLDIHTAFTSIVNPDDPYSSPQVARQFTHKLEPCCRSLDPNGYCGQVDEKGKPQHTICNNPEHHFFWDDVHPSEAGWEAVMGLLEDDLKDFLGM